MPGLVSPAVKLNKEFLVSRKKRKRTKEPRGNTMPALLLVPEVFPFSLRVLRRSAV